MTTSPAAWILALSLLPAAALKAPPIPMPGPAPATPQAAAPPSLAETLPPAQRERYELLVLKCGRCHPAEKALEAGFDGEQWNDYLKKKYKRAGAGISEGQMREIGEFLRYWATAGR